MNDPRTTAVFKLVRALSLEIDLFYEDSQLTRLEEAFEALEEGAKELTDNEQVLPDVYLHLLERLARSKAANLKQ